MTQSTATETQIVELKININKQNYPELTQEQFLQEFGLLLHWIQEGVENNEESFRSALIDRYPYYSGPLTGGTIDGLGTYHYPGDEPLPAVATIFGLKGLHGNVNEVLFFYPYGMVATIQFDIDENNDPIPDTFDTWITRMD